MFYTSANLQRHLVGLPSDVLYVVLSVHLVDFVLVGLLRYSATYRHTDRRLSQIPLYIDMPTQQTQNIFITFVHCGTNVEDVWPTLYKCYTNVLCLLGKHSPPSFLHFILMHTYYYLNWLISLMSWVLSQTDYICCFVLFCTCQYIKLIELNPVGHWHD